LGLVRQHMTRLVFGFAVKAFFIYVAGSAVATLPSPTCEYVLTAIGADVTEGVPWEYGYPDFSNGAKRRVAVQTCTSATQRSVRVGPFTSRAGGSYDIVSGLIDSMFSAGDRITTFRAVPATHSGEPIGYPPIYVHHIHVGRLTHYYDEHWFTTHGDYSVGSDYGIGAHSTKGYTTVLPRGHCFAVDCPLPFAVQAILQDMRSVPTAPNMTVFIDVTFGLAAPEAPIEAATLVWNEAPHGPFGYSRFAVLNEPAMSWWIMRWPAAGVLLPSAKLHSHYARHHRLFILDAAPQQLAFLASHVKGIRFLHESVKPTSGHETMLLLNLSHTEDTISRLPSLICQDDSLAPSFMVAATALHPNASRWARRRDLLCSSHQLAKGRMATFVQLYRPVAEPEVKLYPMHTNTWFYLHVPSAKTSSDIKTVSYRYATYRTTNFDEPFQDEAFGSCQGRPNTEAVASYVSNNALGLAVAVSAHQTDRPSPTANVVQEGGRGSALALPSSAAAMVSLAGMIVALRLVGRDVAGRARATPTLL